jgi:hypothetical protein
VFVSLTVKLTDSTRLDYSYLELLDGNGQMGFKLTNQNAEGTNPLIRETVEVGSAWQPDGIGRAQLKIVEGEYVGAHYDECWDQKFDTTWWFTSWNSVTQGVESSSCKALGKVLETTGVGPQVCNLGT